MSRLEDLRRLRAEIHSVISRHGATDVCVFGSVVRGEDGPDSDVDLLVDFQPGIGLLSHAALIRELEQLLGCKVDVVSRNGLKSRLRSRVLAEAVSL